MVAGSVLAKSQRERVNNDLVGAAGVHYVASELSIRGMIALPTIRNTAGYDLLVLSTDGKRHANLQVKTSHKSVSCWPLPSPDKVRAGENDYYVLVRRTDENRFEAFMLSGRETKEALEVELSLQEQAISNGTRKDKFYCIWVEGERASDLAGGKDKWAAVWNNWNINRQPSDVPACPTGIVKR